MQIHLPDCIHHALPAHTPITVVHRGGHPEQIHCGSVAVTDADGKLLAWAGDTTSPMFTRSALKPFQAMPLIAHHADEYKLSPPEIALLCASHNGDDTQTACVNTLLGRAGASEALLACGSMALLLVALLLPLSYRFNSVKARSWLFLIIGVLGGCFGLVASVSPDLMQLFNASDEVLLTGLVAAFVGLLAVYFVSYKVCVGIYKRKEY